MADAMGDNKDINQQTPRTSSASYQASSKSPRKMSQLHALRDAQKSSQVDPLKRTRLACKRCQKRKTKCFGTQPCPTCVSAGHECVYEEGQRKTWVPQSYLSWLESRVMTYENQSQTQPATSPSSGYEGESDDIDVLEGMATLYINSSGEKQTGYVGNSSSTLLSDQFRKLVRPMSGDSKFESYPTYNWPRRNSVSVTPDLPPIDQAKRLYGAQHIYIGTIFSFLQPQDFERRLEMVYSHDLEEADLSNRETCLSYCQILLIFAYGQMYSVNQWAGSEGPPGFTYFMQALQLLPEIHEEGSILFVEVLSLVGYYMQNLNRRDAAFLYIGLALRMAISLGLHQEFSDPTMDAVEREHRRRVWWSVYSMDRILCVKSGNPITIADEDIGVSLPSPLPVIEDEHSPATTLAHYTLLSKILGRIMEGIYRKTRRAGAGSHLVASVQEIMADLAQWIRDLPSHLRIDFTKIDTELSRESVSVFLHYYQCINMTARPLLFHVVQRCLEAKILGQPRSDWREGLSQPTVNVIDSCITAAHASTKLMTAASAKNLVATYGFMDGEHAFSAALVLVMINVAFPHNPRDEAALESALGVLFWMADRGNTHIKTRHSLLMDLRSFDLTTTEDVGLFGTVSGIDMELDFDLEAALRDEFGTESSQGS